MARKNSKPTPGRVFSEELFQTIFAQAGDGIFLADAQGRYVEVNARGCEMLGYTREELLQLSMQDLIPSEEEASDPIRYDILRAGGGVVRERYLKKKNGSLLRVEINGRVLSNGYMLGLVRDVSERQLIEQSMRELAGQWQATFDATSDAILLLNRDQRILRSNRAMQTLFRLSADEMAGKYCWEVVHGADGPLPNCPTCRMLKTLRRETLELNREGRWLDVTVDPVLNSDGVLLAAIHVIRDVTERKQAEEAIRLAEKRYKSLIENAPDGIVLIDADGRFKYISKSAQNIFGYKSEEILHTDPADLAHPQDLQTLISLFNYLLGNPSQVSTLQYRFRHKDGSWRWLESTFSNLLAEPSVEALVVNFRDITEQRQAIQSMQESEEKYRQLFNLGADAVFLIDNEVGQIKDANHIASALYGYSHEELLKLCNVDLSAQPSETRGAVQTGLTKIPIRFHRKKDGTIFPVEIAASHITYMGRPAHIAFIRDISERLKAEQALIESEEKFRSLVEQSPDGIIIVDESGLIVEWNRGQELLSGRKREVVLGQPIWEVQYQLLPSELRVGGFVERVKRNALHTLSTGLGGELNLPRETVIQHPDGVRRNVEIVMYTYKTDIGYRVGSIARDITERKQVEKRLEYMAMHDDLTGLPNRQLFQDRLSSALERARREKHGMLAVMLLDLDNFKEVNDTYGHACGDQLLWLMAQRLHNCLRKSDTAARMGGDEFTLINEDVTDVDACVLVAQKVLSAISEPMQIEDHTFVVTASIGISLYPVDSDDATTLLREADIAMYQAKRARNCFRFYNPSFQPS